MSIQKPFTQQLHERHFGGTNGLELDAGLVARAFGVAYAPGDPLPENEIPQTHAEDDGPILPDTRAQKPQPKPSILTLAMARLQSVKPQTPQRAKQLKQAVARLMEPLKFVDDLVATLEEERFQAIDQRREAIRIAGRELVEALPALHEAVAVAREACNASGERKQQRVLDVQNYHLRRRKISIFASEKEIEAADKALQKARDALADIAEVALADQRALAAAESAFETCKANIENHKMELHRLEAELRGEAYFDPATGLSTDPKSHQANW